MFNRVKFAVAGLALMTMTGVAAAAGPGYGLARNTDCPVYKQRAAVNWTGYNRLQERRWRNTNAPGFQNGRGMGYGPHSGWRGRWS
jgi:hypothetical protein